MERTFSWKKKKINIKYQNYLLMNQILYQWISNSMPLEVMSACKQQWVHKICFSFFPNGEFRASWEVKSHATKLSKFVHRNSKHPCKHALDFNLTTVPIQRIATIIKEYSQVAWTWIFNTTPIRFQLLSNAIF